MIFNKMFYTSIFFGIMALVLTYMVALPIFEAGMPIKYALLFCSTLCVLLCSFIAAKSQRLSSNEWNNTESIMLPKGLRIEVVDNKNLSVPVGTKATLTMNERILFKDFSHIVTAEIDGQKITSRLPFELCKIITDNFNEPININDQDATLYNSMDKKFIANPKKWSELDAMGENEQMV
jgi:hypothetical protein